jgi:hypothetical protein
MRRVPKHGQQNGKKDIIVPEDVDLLSESAEQDPGSPGRRQLKSAFPHKVKIIDLVPLMEMYGYR